MSKSIANSGANSVTDAETPIPLDTLAAILERRSARHFSKREVDQQLLLELLYVTNRSPSGFNLQPWQFLIVRDPIIKRLLSHIAMDQKQIETAPVTVVFIADPSAWQRDFDRILLMSKCSGSLNEKAAAYLRKIVRSHFATSGFAPFRWLRKLVYSLQRLRRPATKALMNRSEATAYVRAQTMLAAGTFLIAAQARGLDTCPVEGFDEDRLKKLLAIPQQMSVPLIIPVGYALEIDDRPPSLRLPLVEKTSIDLFPNKLYKDLQRKNLKRKKKNNSSKP